MKLRNKLLIPILILSFVLFAAYETKDFYSTIQSAKQIVEQNNQKHINSLIEFNKQQTRSIALQLINDDRVVEAYLKNDPEILKTAISNIWHTLKQQKIIHEIHFFKPPAISFVNFSNFGSLGKDVSGARKDIVWVTQSFSESNHLMFCKTYAGIRSTQPIIDPKTNKILGGVSLGKQMDWIPQTFQDFTDNESVLLYNNTLAKQLDPKFYDEFLADKQIIKDFVVSTSTTKFPRKALQMLDFTKQSTDLKIDDRYYSFNILKLKDFNQKDMAYILIANDLTKYYEAFYQKLFEHFALLLLSIVLLMIFYKFKFDEILKNINSMKQLASMYKNKKFNNIEIQTTKNSSDEMEELKNEIIYLGRDLEIFYKDSLSKQDELEDINNSLKKIIDDEIKKNRSKEKILFQQSKLASMGEMIGNIAHQWRQPLSMISTTASGIKLEYEYGLLNTEKLPKSLDNIVEATKHLSQTIEDFRAFYNPDKKLEFASTKKIVDETMNLIQASLKSSHIEIIVLADDFTILTLPNELKQALLNILSNAKDALIANENLQDKAVYFTFKQSQNQTIISIYDNAGGINEDILPKIFEPFFTTKSSQNGTGIGLYMTHAIVKEHLFGEILVENFEFVHNYNQYTGAKFTIILPNQE